MFHLCHEWRWDGSFLKSKQKGKSIKSGFYTRLEWPNGDIGLKQSSIVYEVMSIILDEKNKSFSLKVR